MNRFCKSIVLVTYIATLFECAEPARILAAIPTPSYSHQVFFQRLWRELAVRGHEVVVMTTDPTWENITTLKEIDMGTAYNICRPFFQKMIDANNEFGKGYQHFIEGSYQVAVHELALPQVRQLLDNRTEHFDLVMVESLYPAFFALPHRFKAPFIGVNSLDALSIYHNIMGNSVHSVLFPHLLVTSQVNLSFKERLTSFFLENVNHFKRSELQNKINTLNRKFFGEDCPDYIDLVQSIDMLFINNNPLFTHMRPLSPSTISIAGGLHLQPPKALPIDLQKFLDTSTQGAIYLSLGSNVKSSNLSNVTLITIIETFKQLPYNVLWKFEDDNLMYSVDNIRIMKWVPQQDVLRHKNIKLFITQAGMQSLEEALFAHVPLIVMPFFADQEGNAVKVVNKGVALQLNHKTLTVEDFNKTIFEVIYNPTYKANMKKLATQIQDQPMTPLERAIWWTEYILRHKSGQHLKGPKIPLYQYFYLDIWAFLVGCVAACLAVVNFVCLGIYSLCKRVSQIFAMKIKKA